MVISTMMSRSTLSGVTIQASSPNWSSMAGKDAFVDFEKKRVKDFCRPTTWDTSSSRDQSTSPSKALRWRYFPRGFKSISERLGFLKKLFTTIILSSWWSYDHYHDHNPTMFRDSFALFLTTDMLLLSITFFYTGLQVQLEITLKGREILKRLDPYIYNPWR